MSRHIIRYLLTYLSLVAAAVSTLSGCAAVRGHKTIDQRSVSGPTAEQMWNGRVLLQNGRPASFDERMTFQNDLDQKISHYLARHPEVANSLDVSTFRLNHEVMVGMSKEEVETLLDTPDTVVKDRAKIEELARRFAPAVKKADEAWVYPLGWRFYFEGPKLIAITQYLPR